MKNQMDESYFNEKRLRALESIDHAEEYGREATGLILSLLHKAPDVVSPKNVHALLKSAISNLTDARLNFEKARWAAARTNLDFVEWAKTNDCEELTEGFVKSDDTAISENDTMLSIRDLPTLGARLLAARKQKGLSASAVAARVGIHQASIMDLERGLTKSLGYAKLRAFSEIYGVTVECLAGCVPKNKDLPKGL